MTQLNQQLVNLKNEYNTFKAHHTELSEYVLPRLGRWLVSDTNKGGKKNGKIYDNTGKIALGILSSGLMSGLTSPARPWFNLQHPDPDMQERQGVKIWSDAVRRRMNTVYARSNLYNSLPRSYSEMILFGQGPMGVFADDRDVIHTQSYTAGEYYIANDRRGIVDTFAREYRMTVIQVVSTFGLENCSTTVRDLYDRGSYNDWVDLCHVVEPNVGRDSTKLDAQNKPFRSIYWEKSSKEKVLEFTGFDEFPILCPRWDVNSGDVYASSCPAMDALGDIKQLQMHEKRGTEAIDKNVRPPMVADPTMRNQFKTQTAGGVTYSTFINGKPGYQEAYRANISIADLEGKSAQIRERIKKAFYVDLFLAMTTSDRRQITAREVEERHEEKLLMLGPVLERLNKELLDPLINRTFNIMWRRGLIPQPPPELEGVELKIEYVSVLHQAQRSVGVSAIDRLMGFASNVVQFNPPSRHKIDFDQTIDEYARMLGTSPSLIRSDEEAKALGDQEIANQVKQQNLTAGLDAAKAVKELSQAQGGDNTALETVINSVQQQQQQ
jgi:hypothetical protein